MKRLVTSVTKLSDQLRIRYSESYRSPNQNRETHKKAFFHCPPVIALSRQDQLQALGSMAHIGRDPISSLQQAAS